MATLDRLAPPPAAQELVPAWNPRRAIVVALLIVTTIALLQVVQSSSFAHTGRSMQQLETERNTLTAQLHELEAEVAALSSLDRTERAARERLGMVPAGQITYVAVGVESPSGALLPRPLVSLSPTVEGDDPWWQALIQSLPLR